MFQYLELIRFMQSTRFTFLDRACFICDLLRYCFLLLFCFALTIKAQKQNDGLYLTESVFLIHHRGVFL